MPITPESERTHLERQELGFEVGEEGSVDSAVLRLAAREPKVSSASSRDLDCTHRVDLSFLVSF